MLLFEVARIFNYFSLGDLGCGSRLREYSTLPTLVVCRCCENIPPFYYLGDLGCGSRLREYLNLRYKGSGSKLKIKMLLTFKSMLLFEVARIFNFLALEIKVVV